MTSTRIAAAIAIIAAMLVFTGEEAVEEAVKNGKVPQQPDQPFSR